MKDVVVIPLRVQENVVRTLRNVGASTWIVPDDFQMPDAVKAKVVRYSTALDIRFQIPELAAASRAAAEINKLGDAVTVHAPRAGGIVYLASRNTRQRTQFELHGEATTFDEAWIDRARAIYLHMEANAISKLPRVLPCKDFSVTAVIPVFNLHQYLERTLASLESQTREIDEILIVDDGSDNAQTVEALKELEGTERARIVWKPHTGLSATRNHGINLAKSSHILTLDADDCIRPTFVERAIERLSSDESVVLATSMVSCFSDDVDEATGGWCPLGFDRDLLTVYNFASCATAIMPRALLLEVGGYDESFAAYEDWELYCRLASRGKAAVIPEFLIDVRIRADSMLRTLPRIMHESLRSRIIEKHGGLALNPSFAMRLLQSEYVEFYRGVMVDPNVAARELIQSQLRYRLADKVNDSLKKLGVQGAIKMAGEEWSKRS